MSMHVYGRMNCGTFTYCTLCWCDYISALRILF